MRKILVFSAVLTVLFTAFRPAAELPIGSSIPNAGLALRSTDGSKVSLQGSMGKKGLLVMFSCNTCPFVVKYESRTAEVAKWAKASGFGVVLINSNEGQRGDDDSYAAMQKYAKKQGYNWAYVVDEKSRLADAFGATRTPENFLFDAGGKLVYHGAIDDNASNAAAVGRAHLQEAIKEVLAGKKVSMENTRSVGCSIKR